MFSPFGDNPPKHLVNKKVLYNPPPTGVWISLHFWGDYITCPHLSRKKQRSLSPSKPNPFLQPARQARSVDWKLDWTNGTVNLIFVVLLQAESWVFSSMVDLDLLSVESDQALVICKANRKQQIFFGKAKGLNQHWSDERNPLVMREKLVLKPLDGEKKEREPEVMSWWKWEIQC